MSRNPSHDTLLSPIPRAEEQSFELSLRPKALHQYIGQSKVKENMEISIRAALKRQEALDHVLLYGPPGLGKTTLAAIVANELGVSIRTTSGPIIEKRGDLAAILTNLKPSDVLFIDEIHRLHPAIEEILYPAMEDLLHRHHDRRRPRRPQHPHAAAAFHAHRGHDPRRTAYGPAARTVRDHSSPGVLQPR